MQTKFVPTYQMPSEYDRQAAEARRRQAMAEALEAQAYQPLSGSDAPTPAAAPLVMALQSFLSARQRNKAMEAAKEAKGLESQYADRMLGRLQGGYVYQPDKELEQQMAKKPEETLTQYNERIQATPFTAKAAAIPEQTELGEVTRQSQYRKSPDEVFGMAMTPVGTAALKRAPMLAAALERSMTPAEMEEFGTTVVRTKDGKAVIVGKRGTVKELGVELPEEGGITPYQQEMLDLKRREIGLRERIGASRGGKALSPTVQKEVFETDENILATETGIDLLNQARQLSDKSFEGLGAGQRAQAATLLPDAIEPAGAKETLEFDLLLKQQVLPQLRAIFGAAPTEGERAILLELQGSSSLPIKTRNAVLDRALQAAERRLQFNRQKSSQLREGTYFNVPSPELPEGFDLEQ